MDSYDTSDNFLNDDISDADLFEAARDDVDQPYDDFPDDGVTDSELVRAAEEHDSQRSARIQRAEFLHILWQSTTFSLEGLLVPNSHSHRSYWSDKL